MSSIVFKPTFLYIKQHSVTGLLYFGKTSKGDPVKYKGSGTYWKRHIKQHGVKFVETIWYCLFLDAESIKEFELSFSINNNIVEDTRWANLVEETGIGGPPLGLKRSEETCKKIGDSKRGIRYSDEVRRKMSESKKGLKTSFSYPESNPAKTEKFKSMMQNENPMFNEVTKEKVSKTIKDKWDEDHEKMYNLQKYADPERNEKIRQSKIGNKNPMYGNTHAADHLNNPEYECIHGGIKTTKGNISRWHNDNCKQKS